MSLKNTLSWLLLLLFTAMNASALDIPQGTFYFDNSLTRYTTVKFVYGSYSNPESYVITMTHEGNDLWSITIPERVTGMYRYTFAETSLSDGLHNETFPNLKDYITNTLGEKRTATCDLAIPVGWIFTPSNGNNWAAGSWKRPAGEPAYSGTLPVLFIDTENSPTALKTWGRKTRHNSWKYADVATTLGAASTRNPIVSSSTLSNRC